MKHKICLILHDDALGGNTNQKNVTEPHLLYVINKTYILVKNPLFSHINYDCVYERQKNGILLILKRK